MIDKSTNQIVWLLIMIIVTCMGLLALSLLMLRLAVAADLPIPKLHHAPSQATFPLIIGKTPMPKVPEACTKQLKEMRLCQ